jgi:hypothetical protein
VSRLIPDSEVVLEDEISKCEKGISPPLLRYFFKNKGIYLKTNTKRQTFIAKNSRGGG